MLKKYWEQHNVRANFEILSEVMHAFVSIFNKVIKKNLIQVLKLFLF